MKDAALEQIAMRRMRSDDLSARCIAVLNDLPVTSAVEVRPEPIEKRVQG